MSNLDQVEFFVEVYSDFKSQLPRVLTLVSHASKCASFSMQQTLLTLTSSIHKPIQRIRQYLSFLTHLLLCTPVDHDDYPATLEAWMSFRRAIHQMNDQVKLKEKQERVSELESSLEAWEVLFLFYKKWKFER